MTPPTYNEENKDYIDRLFNGKMETVLVVCHKCNNIHLTERGPSLEFSSQYCPFCLSKRSSDIINITPDKLNEAVDALSNNLSDTPESLELANKIKRVILESSKQRFNIAACKNCNNRYIFLDEDIDEIEGCAFCKTSNDDLESLIEYSETSNENNAPGFHNYIGKLFYLKLKNGIENNFILSDFDSAFNRFRFVSSTDDRMAFWISNDEILSMLEFIKLSDIIDE